MSLLITPTLLNSYDWFLAAPEKKKKGTDITWKEDAYQQIYSTLSRASFRPNKAIIKGIEFEKLVYKNADNDLSKIKSSEHFKKVCELVKGGDYQYKAKKFIDVDDKEYVVFSRLDVRLPNKIIDIKTTGNYKGKGQYLKGWQHIVYTYITGIPNFEYVVAEWNDVSNDDYSIKDIHVVPFVLEDSVQAEKQIIEHIRMFMNFINNDETLSKEYYNTYNLF